MILKDKIALVTGASRGIGAAVCKRFAREGAHVIMIARDLQSLQMVDDQIKEYSDKTTLIQLDLCELNKIADLAGMLMNRFGLLDILVGNAGILGELSPIRDYCTQTWQQVITVNLHANYYLLKYFDPLLQRSPSGRGIFVTSNIVNQDKGIKFWGAYAASKAALQTLVKTYAFETQHTDVRVNLVDPGGVGTDMYKQAFPGQEIHEITSPDEVTDIFVKLASDKCKRTARIYYAQY